MPQAGKAQVFVYGSLREGFGNHRLLERAEFLGSYRAELPFVMISLGGFPGLIESQQDNNITLELYQVTPQEFQNLDQLEGYPSFYDRKKITVNGTKGWVYYLTERSGSEPLVESGDWVEYTSKGRASYNN